ncbi:transposase domain-containing protein [Nocardia rhizosphaerihabitans]|uniref:transposase domain-containing protein n=1 Tax=Nocardia rhizosphaerihabitans TaxID=1691570 RepID=UPI001667FEA0|nr:transposase domain-containing protein [Nocardia rhizosphaerihabitans]
MIVADAEAVIGAGRKHFSLLRASILRAVARVGAARPADDRRWPDFISFGLLTRVFPPDVVDAALIECGRVERRDRLLPARFVVYYVLSLALFAPSSYDEVMRKVMAGLEWALGWPHQRAVPTKAALFQARKRLGAEPLRVLFEKVAVPLADPGVPGGFYRSWRLMSIDRSTLELPASETNVEHFGSPAAVGGPALPRIRVVGLIECGSRAVIDVAFGTCGQDEQTLIESLVRSLRPGMLLLADQGLLCHRLWDLCRSSGADLLWQTASDAALPVEKRCADVRVIDYSRATSAVDTVHGGARTGRLLTTITDSAAAPAAELVGVLAEQRDVETLFGVLATHRRGAGAVLRSKSPDGVIQELYSYLCVHYAVRSMMRWSGAVK